MAVLLITLAAAYVSGEAIASGSADSVELIVRFAEDDARPLSEAERKVVRRMAQTSVAQIEEVLPGTPERIELVVTSGSRVIPGFGSVGLAAGPQLIGWTIDPTFGNGPAETVRRELRSTLFHEVHHLVRGWTYSGGTAGRRMIDAAVAEGMATAFERDQIGWDPPWGRYPRDAVAGWVVELRDMQDLARYGQWMFEHLDGRRWIGYRAGTYIVDRAMEACGCTAADLVSRSTEDVLEMADIGG